MPNNLDRVGDFPWTIEREPAGQGLSAVMDLRVKNSKGNTVPHLSAIVIDLEHESMADMGIDPEGEVKAQNDRAEAELKFIVEMANAGASVAL